ncbi:hypothetical protein D3C77_444550 [compost metagenome]
MANPYLFLAIQRVILHAWLGNRPVHIPLNKLNFVVVKKVGHKYQDELLDLRLGYVQQQLIAQLCPVPCREMINPVWMLSIQFTVWIDRFRLNPNAEFHAELMYPTN